MLKPELVYVFRLTAQTRKGWGEAAEALVVTTEKRGVCGGVFSFLTIHTCRFSLRMNLLCVSFSPTPTHEPSCGASGGSPGSQSHFVVGAGQRRPLPRSLLHSPVPRAAGQQLDSPLRISEPRDALLHGGQVNGKVYARQ